MLMLHGTSRQNLLPICRHGILAEKSRNPNKKSVWLCAPGMMGKAIAHAMKRHRIRPENVVVFTVNIPRSWLRADHKGRKGIKHTGGRDIPKDRILSAHCLAKLG